MDLVSAQMRRDKRRFSEKGKIGLSERELDLNRQQRTVLKKVNEIINNNPNAILEDKELLDKISTRVDRDGNIYKSKIDLSKLRLQRLGFFKDVNIETPKVPNSNDQVDVNVNVEEQPSGTLTASLGYSGSSGFIFSLGVSQNNFLGTGNKVSVNLNRSDTSDSYNLSFLDPYFTLDGVSRGYNLYYKKTKIDSLNVSRYATDSKGASLTFGYPMCCNSTPQNWYMY